MVEHWQQLLQGVVENPGCLGKLQWISQVEQQQLLAQWSRNEHIREREAGA